MTEFVQVTATVNGEKLTRSVEPRTNLVDFVRYDLELTGSHVGCEHGVCGACTIRLNGEIVRGCLILAVQVDGEQVETIEGLSEDGSISDLQDEFLKRNAGQCGSCTPGMLLTADSLLNSNPTPTREEIREYISGNYCRCTGFEAIVDAIENTSRIRSEEN
ncbi:MAG: (2Fe-2S)-binding protein [Pseudomonadota bacterium]|nr:(2Fe-2S)-binding protein [Pseudomonadota bacterium]